MDFLKQYLKIINYSILGIIFAFTCFYFLANCYHYLELRRDYTADISSLSIIENINGNLEKINNNINSFNPNTYKGKIPTNTMMRIQKNLGKCYESINNDSYKNAISSNRINIIDVYNLREAYENNISNTCLVNNLSWLTLDTNNINSDFLNSNKKLIAKQIDLLLTNTTYLKKDILNNSSYFYNTNIASNSVKSNTRDGFYEVMDAYNFASDFVLYMSDWFKMEVEG